MSNPVLRPDAVALLACPHCRQVLALDARTVLCTGCKRRYPVIDGIPVLIQTRELSDRPGT